jgi:adenosylcobinamide-phosphate synthase
VGLAVYKAINTMDSMIGYKNERYLYFGRVAARLDDVVNFIPARLAAGIIILLAWILRDDVRGSFRCFRVYRHMHSSPNAGCTEAAMSGALGIALSGPTMYFGQWVDRPWIGEKNVPIQDEHLKKVLVYVIGTGIISVFMTLGLLALRMR